MIDIINILKYMSSSQYNSLKQIALNILTGKIPLTTFQYNKLSSHKLFIRKLARSRVSKTFISRKSKVIYTLVNIALKHHAACSKVGTSKNGRLVKKKKDNNMKEVKQVTVNIPQSQKVATSPQKVATSTQVIPQQGSGKVSVKNLKEKRLKMIIHCLTPKRKKRALTMMKLIKNSKDFNWTDGGEFIYKGKIITHSNIKTLITYALWNTEDKPKGMKQFYQALAMLKVPKNIVVNEIGKSIIRKFRNSKDNM